MNNIIYINNTSYLLTLFEEQNISTFDILIIAFAMIALAILFYIVNK